MLKITKIKKGKFMGIEKLPSGNYRVRKMYNGKMYRVTFDHKPNDMEIMEELSMKFKRQKAKPKKDMTVQECIVAYVEYKDDKLSPSTQKEYLRLSNRLSEAFLSTYISEVDQFAIDNEIKRLKGLKISPKTIHNYMKQSRTAIKKFYPQLDINLDMLPDIEPTLEEPYIPTKAEVKSLLAYVNKNDPMFYIPLALAALCGLRRSEIIGIKLSDISDDYNLSVTTALVEDNEKNWVQKGTKNFTSTRIVPIPKPLAERIKIQGYVYNGHPASIGKALKRIEKEMGLPDFSLHKLRHFYITELWEAKLPEADILYLSGHSKKSDINKIIYRHQRISSDLERRQQLASQLTSSFFD